MVSSSRRNIRTLPVRTPVAAMNSSIGQWSRMASTSTDFCSTSRIGFRLNGLNS